MKKSAFILSIFCLILVNISCNESAMNPGVFERTLVDYVQKTHEEEEVVQNAIDQLHTYGADSNFLGNKTRSDYNSAINNTKNYLEQVEKIKAPDGGENLKQAVITYLKSVLEMLEVCEPLFQLSSETSDSETKQLLENMVEKEGIAATAFTQIQIEQDLFDETK